MSSELIWVNENAPNLPRKISDISELVSYGLQLTTKDKRQIVSTYNSGSYEMVSSYVWIKAIGALRYQLSKMGISFIAEMLDRSDIDEQTNLQDAISEYEAIRLAEELGVISGSGAFRLKKAMETVSFFNKPELDDDPDNELSEDEAKTIIRSCVQGILGYNKIEAAIDFKNFREELENHTLNDDSPHVIKLLQSPYFFHRTTIRILISLIKSRTGAQLENSLANSNLIIPQIWNNLKHPERYQVGRSYSELFTDGKNKASSGLKKVLLKVKGFDFVPEDLRSTSFINAANDVFRAHEGINNFYNEPAAINTLAKMGSVIPAPALAHCISAALCVRLGNYYGRSHAAQNSAQRILASISYDRWVYYFNECIVSDDRILYKVMSENTSSRWLDFYHEKHFNHEELLGEINNRSVRILLQYSSGKDLVKLKKLASGMYAKLGYGVS